MTHEYWCAGHDGPTTLDRHGRCAHCSSDAVDVLSRERSLIPSPEVVDDAMRQLEISFRDAR